jgi:Family of unknown function (DUF5681)
MSEFDEPDYEVGKGRPPKSHQWKQGQSGNPKGRPPERKTGAVDIHTIFDDPIHARIGGKPVKISAYEAGFRKLVKKAVDGHLPSMREVLRRCEDYGLIAPPKAAEDGGVVIAPPGRDFYEWLDEVTEWVPAHECD